MGECRGQSIIEYTIIVGIIVLAIFYMSTAIKRGVQSMIRITADQVGNQAQSDQDFRGLQGYVEFSNTITEETNSKQAVESGYIPAGSTADKAVYTQTITPDDTTYTISNVITNGGFTPN